MADWRCLTTLDIAESLRQVADEVDEDRDSNREEVNHHHHHQCQKEDQVKWTLVGIVVAIVVIHHIALAFEFKLLHNLGQSCRFF